MFYHLVVQITSRKQFNFCSNNDRYPVESLSFWKIL